MGIAAPAQPHDGKVEAIVGAEYLTVAFRGRGDGHPCRAYCERIEKITPSDHFCFSFDSTQAACQFEFGHPSLCEGNRTTASEIFRYGIFPLIHFAAYVKSHAAPSIHKLGALMTRGFPGGKRVKRGHALPNIHAN